tara:strand:- start:4495 stop:5868 length:1374 start_codon:yes stop_codon:yes gene_type:complete
MKSNAIKDISEESKLEYQPRTDLYKPDMVFDKKKSSTIPSLSDESPEERKDAQSMVAEPLDFETATFLANAISALLKDENFKKRIIEKTPFAKVDRLEKGLDRFTKLFKKEVEELINKNIRPTAGANVRGMPPEVNTGGAERVKIEEALKQFVCSATVRRVMTGVLFEIRKRRLIEQTQHESSFRLVNETDRDVTEMTGYLNEFLPFSQKEMGYDRSVTIKFISDPSNAQKTLGKTAFYNPAIDEVSVYVDERHPKDILRSVSHELVHHAQNCRGEFDGVTTVGEQPYMQTSEHLSEMERQAYEVGNMTFRTWEDNYKHNQMENKKMKINEEAVRKSIRAAVRKVISEGVTRLPSETGPLSDEEIRAFLKYKGLGGEELTRYKQGDPDMHRAPGTESPFGKGESHWRRSKPPGVTDADVEEVAPKEEEEDVKELEERSDKGWYNSVLSETLAKRYTK